jgi:glycosyltransferase involved in cell wall biosynthesis
MVAVVVPCLNEEQNVVATCRSLGFGVGGYHNGALILVDNGSTDHTLEVARNIQASARAESVHVVEEQDRGFVPARARGVQVVCEVATARGLTNTSVLIIQADADTLYDSHYVELMIEAAVRPTNRITAIVPGENERAPTIGGYERERY